MKFTITKQAAVVPTQEVVLDDGRKFTVRYNPNEKSITTIMQDGKEVGVDAGTRLQIRRKVFPSGQPSIVETGSPKSDDTISFGDWLSKERNTKHAAEEDYQETMDEVKAELDEICDKIHSEKDLYMSEVVYLQDHQEEVKKLFPEDPRMWEWANIDESEWRKAQGI